MNFAMQIMSEDLGLKIDINRFCVSILLIVLPNINFTYIDSRLASMLI